MKTRPITPAQIEFGHRPVGAPEGATDGVPYAPAFGDVYHPRVGAAAQARHVFLRGNGLPGRWAGRDRFTVLETGFGLGHNFLACWAAWRADPERCRHLHYVAIEAHPPCLDDLVRAHASWPEPALAAQLRKAWPPPTPNLHALDFEAGCVQLLLALGDVTQLLPALRLQADAFFLDGFAPARNPQMWQAQVLKALGARAAAGATLATWSVARELREGLTAAGFDVQRAPGTGGKREITIARHAPRFAARRPLPVLAVAARHAVVVGAGLAGAAVALALARQGLAVTVVERHATAAAEASGNPAGLFHATVHGDDGTYARLYRSAALQAARDYAPALAGGQVAGNADGLLRLAPAFTDRAALHAVLQRLGLPRDFVQALDATAASACAGVALAASAWWYPQGGWMDPGAWVRQALAAPAVRWIGGAAAGSLRRRAADWQVLDTQGRLLAEAPLLVLANAGQAAALLAPLGHSPWPVTHSRGQLTWWTGTGSGGLLRPVAGDGYAVPLGDGGLLCGATREPGSPDGETAARAADHAANAERLRRLTGLAPPPRAPWHGRVAWRLHSADGLPIAGALPTADMPPDQRMDPARLLPREPGLFVLTALGARGLTLAPLLGRLVAAQATGTPWPLEQDLCDAIDPARWRVRAARITPG